VDRLTHVDDEGSPQMVDISGKSASLRVAVAEGVLQLLPSHVAALGSLPKGDALTVAQIAGIQGGKRCSELIPLCHQVLLTHLDVEIMVEQSALRITATAKTEASTGVEMEAYTTVAVAGITLIDMLKGVDPDLRLTDIRLLRKTGGKSDWSRG
jgi:cyclic pyranopterin monophosphate synthase